MFFIVLGIVIIIILIALFLAPTENSKSSDMDWWTIGMIADLHNKAREKNKK